MFFLLHLFLVLVSTQYQSFGTGRSQIHITDTEFELLNYTVSNQAKYGAITFFWITGGPIGAGAACGVDLVLWRFYVDGETTPSVGPLQTSQYALVGENDPSAPWDNEYFGKNAKYGGWHANLLIPFSKSIRVTLQLPVVLPTKDAYVMVRGVENIPLRIGSLDLPPEARLQTILKMSVNLPVLSFHRLVDLDNGQGFLFGTMIDLNMDDSGTLNSLEGCWHAYFPGTVYNEFPGLLLGTGSEDYPESAYYFNAGPYRGPTSGLTVYDPAEVEGGISKISFYKLHYRDPILFTNGFQFDWRNGDVTDPKSGEKCIAMAGNTIGRPGISNVTTVTYVYTW